MQVNIGQKKQEEVIKVNPEKGKVVIAKNLIRERQTIDKDGNIIDPRTKRIIKPFEAQ